MREGQRVEHGWWRYSGWSRADGGTTGGAGLMEVQRVEEVDGGGG